MTQNIETQLSLLEFISPQNNLETSEKIEKDVKRTSEPFFLLPLLFDATIDDDYLTIQSLLSKGHDINMKDIDGITPLHLCAFFNCVAACDTLCARRAFVNAKDNHSFTPLFYACKNNHSSIVRTLIEHGADCDAQNKYWQTPLHICALSSDASSAAHIINHATNVDTIDEQGLTPLHYACISGNLDMIKLLIESGANVNLCDRKQNYPLHWASYKGAIDVIGTLLNARANPNCVNDQGLTPLYLCIIENHTNCVRLLLESNANTNTSTHNGSLPIHFAAYNGNIDIFNMLYDRSKVSAANETDHHGNTLFHFAAATKSHETNIIQHLASKIDLSLINSQNLKKQTPLHIAVLHNNEKVVAQLLEAGAISSLTDGENNTPLHLSAMLITQFNQSGIMSSLVSNHSYILCQQNQMGLIPLHIALKNSHYQSIDYLLPEINGSLVEDAQRSLLILDSQGRHSLHYASHSGLTKFIEKYFKQMSKDIINQQDLLGYSPLHYASFKRHELGVFKSLLKLGADVNVKCTKYGAVPLHYVLVAYYSLDIVDELVRAGSDVLICTNYGASCLSFSIMHNDTHLIKILLDSISGKSFDLTQLLCLSCLHGKDNALEYLLENNDNVNLDSALEDGMTPLMLTCYYGYYSCLCLLLYRKVNLKAVNVINGRTSLHYAALNGQSECLLALLQELKSNVNDLNAIVNLRDKNGKTAFHYCVEHSSPSCIRLLINLAGANPNVTDSFMLTPLHYCAIYNCEESLQELLDIPGLKINIFDKSKRLPLHYAAAAGNPTILSALLDYEYDNIADINGFSPLHYAVLRGHETAVRILLNSEINLRCLKTSRITPVHLACIRADATCLSSILSCLQRQSITTMINLPTKVDKYTPLHLAAMKNNGSECIRILLKYESLNVDVKDRLKRTPIMYAIINDIDSHTINILLNRCHDFIAVDHLNNNALHYACIFNNEPIIEDLLRRNSSTSFVEAVNNDNKTPLDLAKAAQISPSIIDLLFSLSGRL